MLTEQLLDTAADESSRWAKCRPHETDFGDRNPGISPFNGWIARLSVAHLRIRSVATNAGPAVHEAQSAAPDRTGSQREESHHGRDGEDDHCKDSGRAF
jgi:hypothetical protein